MRFIKRLLNIKPKDPHKIFAGNYPFLVTGCGRSGTHFTAKFLELNGLDMGHEVTGAQGAVGWLCASPLFCQERGAVFAKKAHQIRHPFNAIRSLVTMNDNSYNYIFYYTPQCKHPDRFIAAARYWVHWNKMALDGAALSIRLEDFRLAPERTVESLSGFFGQRLDPDLIATAEAHGDSRKSRRGYGHSLDLARIPNEDPETWVELEKLARRFDYDPLKPMF
jgi:hypothetical protein